MTELVQKTAAITQDMFPGAYIEPRWSKIDQIKNSPYYTMRYLVGGSILPSPRGQEDYTSIIFEGNEYVLHNDNFKIIKELANKFCTDYLAQRGWSMDLIKTDSLRFHPDIIVDGIQFLTDKAIQLLDIPLDKTRMMWILPDVGPCGEYRSRKPFRYMSKHQDFYAEHTEFANFGSVAWFDVLVLHRSPPVQLLSIAQNLKHAGKVLVFEYDDDIFNVPEWNPNYEKLDYQAQSRARLAIEISDVIICSTEPLREVSGRFDDAMVGPNLIDFDELKSPLTCNRVLNENLAGYIPRSNNKKIEYVHRNKRTLHSDDINETNYDPIRILWAGSNTHDKDLEQIVSAVFNLGKQYGIAVQFIFFGYCPQQFLETQVGAGLSKPKFKVKKAYEHFVQFVPPVKYSSYTDMLYSIDPDFALCPLDNNVFNVSKSPLKVLELGSLGIPCIISGDVEPYKEFVHYENCVKIGKEFRPSWEFAIEELIANPEMRMQLGKNIFDTVYQSHSWNTDSVNRRKWDAIFDKIKSIADDKKEETLQKVNSAFSN